MMSMNDKRLGCWVLVLVQRELWDNGAFSVIILNLNPIFKHCSSSACHPSHHLAMVPLCFYCIFTVIDWTLWSCSMKFLILDSRMAHEFSTHSCNKMSWIKKTLQSHLLLNEIFLRNQIVFTYSHNPTNQIGQTSQTAIIATWR